MSTPARTATFSASGRGRAWHTEYRVITIPPSTSSDDARRLLTEQAEYGHWELDRVRLYTGGARTVRLRRRVIPVRSTL